MLSSSSSSSSSNNNDDSMMIGNDVLLAQRTLYEADCVCFDVDSTVIQEEGIDVLAAYLNKGEQVANVTKQAMGGTMKFQDALSIRLNLLQPSQQQIERCMMIHPFRLSPKIDVLIDTLLNHSYRPKQVYFISGGFRIMIEPIVTQLGLTSDHIIANTILFDSDGLYENFDTNEPTSQDMGKAKAVQSLMDQYQFDNVVMIGDGYTDTQAKPPARTFIGYGGVIMREQVQALSDWYVTDFQLLIDCLQQPSSS
jgi:phosphoserine phosphatase